MYFLTRSKYVLWDEPLWFYEIDVSSPANVAHYETPLKGSLYYHYLQDHVFHWPYWEQDGVLLQNTIFSYETKICADFSGKFSC